MSTVYVLSVYIIADESVVRWFVLVAVLRADGVYDRR